MAKNTIDDILERLGGKSEFSGPVRTKNTSQQFKGPVRTEEGKTPPFSFDTPQLKFGSASKYSTDRVSFVPENQYKYAALKASSDADKLEVERASLLSPYTSSQMRTTSFSDMQSDLSEADELQERIDALRQLSGQYKKEAQGIEYSKIPSAEDFSEYSSRSNSAAGEAYNKIFGKNADEKTLAGLEKSLGPYGEKWTDRTSQLTDQELGVYNYLRNKEGQDSADEYLDYLEETLNQRVGTQQAERLESIENPLLGFGATGLYAAAAGLDQAQTGIQQLFSKEALPTSSLQFGAEQVRENLADDGLKLPEWAGGASIGQAAFDLTQSAANMLPGIALSAATGGAGAPAWAAQIVGAGALGASSGGNAYKEALDAGYTSDQAAAYAVLTGASEGGLQYLLGGIGKLGGKVSNSVISKTVQNIDNAITRVAADLGTRMLGEGTEEYLQEVLNPVFRNIALDENNPVELVSEDAIYAGILGAVTAGLLEGPGRIASGVSESRVPGDAEMVSPVRTDASPAPEAETAPAPSAETVTGTAKTYDVPESLLETLGENGKKAFMSVQREGVDPVDAFKDFARAYNAGKSGMSMTRNTSGSVLDAAQMQTAFYSGQNDAVQTTSTAKPGFVENENSRNISKSERSFYDKLGKAAGVSIVLDSATGEGGYNGYYRNGEVHIAADSDSPGTVVAAHEVTHRLKEASPESYEQFKEYALSAAAGADGVQSLIDAYISQYAESGVTLDREAAVDEIVADYAMELMIDENAINSIVSQNKTVAQKVYDLFQKIVEKIKSAFGRGKSEEVRQLEQARQLWINALKNADTGTSAVSSDASMSIKGTAQLQRQIKNLRERNAALKEQMRTTKGVKTDAKKTAAYAKELLSAYESGYDADTLSSEIIGIYDEIANAGSDVDMDAVRARAQDVASRVLEQSVRENREVYNEYESLRSYLRKTKINVPKSMWSEFDQFGGYNNFRQGNMGRLSLSSKDGVSIDTVYSELAQQYPGLFDEAEFTNPADQLINIYDVLESIQPVVENPYSADIEMASRFVASEILEAYFDIPQQAPTFSDRQKAKLEAERARGNRRLAEERAKNREKISRLRQEGREQVRSAIQKERAKRDEKISAIREKYASREQTARDKRSARELRNKIQRHVKELSQKLTSNTDKKHIYESLKRPVAALLDAINLESAYTVDPETGKRSKNAGGNPTKRTEAFLSLKEQYQKILAQEDSDIVVDPSLLGTDGENGVQGDFDAVIAMRDIRLSDMTKEQLETVWRVVRAVEHSISTAGKVLSQSKFRQTSEWAEAMRRDTAGRMDKRTLTKSHFTIYLEDPYTFFNHYGDAGRQIYKTLHASLDQQQVRISEVYDKVREIVDPKTVEKLEKETKQFTTERGDTLTLTTAQAMEIYELMKRKQAYKHLLEGGVFQPEIDSKKIRRGTESIKLTAKDLADIASSLTEEQVKIADGLQAMTSGLLAEYGNEASMKVYGYKKFNEENYWPIHSSKEGTKQEVEKGPGKARSIKNIGFAQATVQNANNPIDVSSVFDTFSEHSGDMIDYSVWLAPMEDLSRLFNFEFRESDGKPSGRTVKGILDRVGGAGSQDYWLTLMKNIQNGIGGEKDAVSRAISKSIGSFKGAAVGANLRVIIQQPTAFFRAAVALSPADMAKGVARGVTKGNGWKKALKYSPIAMRKDTGGFDISNQARLKETFFDTRTKVQKLNETLSKGAAAADAATWGKLWNACEWKVARENKAPRPGSEAFYSKVNEVFTDMIDQTQVVDSVLHRSQIMRHSNEIVKQAVSFMGEPIKATNILLRAYDQFRYQIDPKKRTAARKLLGRAATAVLVTNAINAVAQSIVDGLRDDDEDKKYVDRVLSAFTGVTGEEETPWETAMSVVFNGNLGSGINPVSQIPFVKDALSIAQGYEVTRTELEIVSELIEAAQIAINSLGGSGSKTRSYAIKELFAAGSKLFGIPVGNLSRDVWGVVRSVAVETDNIPLQYEMEKAIYNVTNDSNKGRYYDIMFRALSQGDMDSYNRIRSDLMDNMGVDGQVIDSAMRSRYNKAVEADKNFTMSQSAKDAVGIVDKYSTEEKKTEETFGPDDLSSSSYKTYSDQRAKDYRDWADEVQGYSSFSRLDENSKDSVLSSLDKLASDMALVDASDGQFTDADLSQWERWATGGSGYGVSETEAVLFKLAYDMAESDKDEDGKTISGSKKENTLEEAERLMPWLTERELEYIMSNFWTPDSDDLKTLRDRKFID